MAFLAIRDRIPFDIRLHAHSRAAWHATSYLYLRRDTRLGEVESHRFHRSDFPDTGHFVLGRRLAVDSLQGSGSRPRPVGRVDARVAYDFAATRVQLRRT